MALNCSSKLSLTAPPASDELILGLVRTPSPLDSTLAAAKLRLLEAREEFKRDFEEDEPQELDDD